MTYERLSATEIQSSLAELRDWTLREDGAALRKTFKFRNFQEAFGFMSQCALSAERLNHHPDWSNAYSSVDVVLSTHAVSGLTVLDFKLAKAMDSAADMRRGN